MCCVTVRFDLLHYGHILLFQKARQLGDRLIVTITADKFVAKGPGRPVFNERQRYNWIREQRSVDDCFIVVDASGVNPILYFRPEIYAKGRDTVQWTEVIAEEKAAIESVGGELVYVDTGTVFHSGDLMSGRYLGVNSAATWDSNTGEFKK